MMGWATLCGLGLCQFLALERCRFRKSPCYFSCACSAEAFGIALTACSARIVADRQTHKPTTVTLAAHVRRGLIMSFVNHTGRKDTSNICSEWRSLWCSHWPTVTWCWCQCSEKCKSSFHFHTHSDELLYRAIPHLWFRIPFQWSLV